MSVRTRFAPSPTGPLHLGNVRIAVFNWLFTRHHEGAFVLRLEDTDVERNVAGAEEEIFRDLAWLGLEWDEGPDVGGPRGPYRQSERSEVYRRAARRLVGEGKAYRCYCTEEELSAEAEEVGSDQAVVRYSGRCRERSAEERARLEAEGRKATVRFRLPELDAVEIEDEIRGPITFPGKDFTDFVILRSDGRPTYNFAVVVDDVDMEISHVVRGAGHLSNTPKQALLFDALEAPRPVFAHLPLVLDDDRRKLSKREGAVGVGELRRQGYPPLAVVNYLSLLGWSHPEEKEVLDLEELIRTVDLDRVGAADTIFDPEKLAWVSSRHLARLELGELTDAVEPFLDRDRFPVEGKRLRWAVQALRSRLSTLADINRHLHFLFPGQAVLEDVWRDLEVEGEEARDVLAVTRRGLASASSWEPDALGAAVRAAGKRMGIRGPALFHPVRKAVTGEAHGPDLGLLLAALGRKETLRRLDEALEIAKE